MDPTPALNGVPMPTGEGAEALVMPASFVVFNNQLST
jgi:hypothetical protein